jgi:regulatory protein
MIQRKNPKKELVLPKIKHYCAYQERCRSEVEERLRSMGLSKKEIEEMVASLVQENYIDEGRFAMLYAGGKFRTSQWGFQKIKWELSKKKISAADIKSALAEISMTEYEKTLEKLAAQKWKLLGSEKDETLKKTKLQDYLLQKGYEWELIKKILREKQFFT